MGSGDEDTDRAKDIVRANDVIHIRFYPPRCDEEEFFAPLFTNQLFPKERIEGCGGSDLRIDLTYTRGSMVSHLAIHSASDADEDHLEKLERKFTDHLDKGTRSKTAFDDGADFVPPFPHLRDSIVAEYSVRDQDFVIMKTKLSGRQEDTESIKKYHRNVQFLMLLSIDGASYIDDEDERWEIYWIFEKRSEENFWLVGYATVYPFSVFRKRERDFRERIRISQVLILPQYRRQGHGHRMLSAIYKDARDRECVEITVEDPSEGFRNLRDAVDLRLCLEEKILTKEPQRTEIRELEPEEIKEAVEKLKLTKAQVMRCHEINLHRSVSKTEGDEDRAKKFRLLVKRRLFNDFEEVLAQLTPDERKRRLAEIFEDVEKEYAVVSEKFPLKKRRAL